MLSRSVRFRALLRRGYFPEELPPPFNTRDLATWRNTIWRKWSAVGNDYPKSTPENYSIPRIGRVRRQLAIVNPVAQLFLSKLIADEWNYIRKHIAQKRSLSIDDVEIVDGDDRAIPKPEFDDVTKQRSFMAGSYDHHLVSDISRFYGTLYTHAIPWALEGKAWCKKNLQKPAYDRSVGARIDRAIRKGRDNQTLGIPVGPDTSRIASEIVAATIDDLLIRAHKLDRSKGFRLIDDWHLGFDTLGEAEAALVSLADACREFELELNAEKTRFEQPSSIEDPIWPVAIRQRYLGGGVSKQANAIDQFFLEAFEHAKRAPQYNVLDFAVKRSLSAVIRPQNWKTYENYLLRVCRINPTTFPAAIQVFEAYQKKGYAISTKGLGKLVDDTIRKAAPQGHYAEVAWALFLCKSLGITLSREAAGIVTKTTSSVCALIALDLEQRGLTASVLNKTLWSSVMKPASLNGSLWLLAYEADLKGWLTGTPANFVESNPYFRELKKLKISFYDVTAVGMASKQKSFSIPSPLVETPHAVSDVDDLDTWYMNPYF